MRPGLKLSTDHETNDALQDDRIQFMRDLYKDGHEFGSHTATHKNMSTLTYNKMHDEMWKAEEMLIRVLGVNPAMLSVLFPVWLFSFY